MAAAFGMAGGGDTTVVAKNSVPKAKTMTEQKGRMVKNGGRRMMATTMWEDEEDK